MDKKNTTIGVLLLLVALGLMVYTSRMAPRVAPLEPSQTSEAGATEAGAPVEPPAIVPGGADGSAPVVEQASTAAAPVAAAPTSSALKASLLGAREGEQLVSLENDLVEVWFTNFGGAIAEVVLKKYPTTKDGEEPTQLNVRRAAAALALQGIAGADDSAVYQLVSQTADAIVWRAVVGGQLEITRTYTLSSRPDERDPYDIRHETTFRNLTDQPMNTPSLSLNVGTAEPIAANDMGLTVGSYDGDDAEFLAPGSFVPGWFARNFKGDSREKREMRLPATSVLWASVKNQFFVNILSPDKPGIGVMAQRVQLVPGNDKAPVGLTGRLELEAVRLEAGASETLGFDLYSGPKEYTRLEKLEHRQDLVMQFGFFGFFSKLLLALMQALHEHVYANWGVAIIGTTLIIRGLMWPITAAGARSAKRMAKIQGPMKELQEKYKDNRQKLSEETMKLFKQHKVNPAGGCLPLFVQIPIFFGLFAMLRSASELRFAEFLWITDLSQPDTVAHIPLPILGGFPLNIMPILMGISMVIQMRMTPTPTTDNAQAKMMKFMPYMMAIMCYGFSSGLAVYWTASNIFSIFQQWITNRRKDPVDEAPAQAAKGGPAGAQTRPGAARGLPVAKKKKK